jgi:signal transduction histidine kinase
VLEVDGVLGLVLLGLWIFALFDVITADAAQVRTLPKIAWFLVVLVLAAVGAVAWLALGRPRRAYALDSGTRGPVWGTRPARGSRAARIDEEADLQARIEARDRMLAAWAEEERKKREGSPPEGGAAS